MNNNWILLTGATLVAVALAAPGHIQAQASRRGTDSGSSGSSGGGGSRPSGDSGSSGGARSAPQGESKGSARPRSEPAPSAGGSQPQGTSQRQPGVSTSGRTPSGTGPAVISSGGARARSNQMFRGTAQPRPAYSQPIGVPYSNYYPYSSYYHRPYVPWYFGSYGYYNSWNYHYGASLWGYPYAYPYGFGFGYGYGYPYGYGTFGYAPYAPYDDPYPYTLGGSADGGGGGGDSDRSSDDARESGSVRLRASPRHARVYVDGALVGTVDDFDGLTRHLNLDTGRHQLELRADGYEPFSMDVLVTAGKTITARASLTKRP